MCSGVTVIGLKLYEDYNYIIVPVPLWFWLCGVDFHAWKSFVSKQLITLKCGEVTKVAVSARSIVTEANQLP
jgi:hypothetical protein